jgi:hypothetical protein
VHCTAPGLTNAPGNASPVTREGEATQHPLPATPNHPHTTCCTTSKGSWAVHSLNEGVAQQHTPLRSKHQKVGAKLVNVSCPVLNGSNKRGAPQACTARRSWHATCWRCLALKVLSYTDEGLPYNPKPPDETEHASTSQLMFQQAQNRPWRGQNRASQEGRSQHSPYHQPERASARTGVVAQPHLGTKLQPCCLPWQLPTTQQLWSFSAKPLH